MEIKKKYGKWTLEEENILRSLSKKAVPLAEIISRIDRTKEAIRTKASKLGVSLRS